jgi:hypothetical protein
LIRAAETAKKVNDARSALPDEIFWMAEETLPTITASPSTRS